MSTSLMKQLMYGKDFSLYGPADFLHILEEWKPDIKPESFNPLIPLTGGVSFLVGDDRATQAIVFGGDWLRQCQDAGASTKNAVICLASNFDDHKGLVALSLELAMVAMKPRGAASFRIDAETFLEILKEIFVKDYAGIQSMSEKWGIEGVKKDIVVPPKRTRSTWRDELGHDVLVHPATLEPCKHEDGSALEYDGIIHDSKSDMCSFKFTHHTTRKEIFSPIFLPTKTT